MAYGKKEDGRGAHKHTPISDFRKQAYLDWLCTPLKERDPTSEVKLSEQLGVTRKTLFNWRDDMEFIEAWEKRYLKTIGNPSRKSEIMDTLYKTATDPDDPKHVTAAKTYFEIEGGLKPTKMEVSVTRPAAELTDDELDAILAEKISSEKQARNAS